MLEEIEELDAVDKVDSLEEADVLEEFAEPEELDRILVLTEVLNDVNLVLNEVAGTEEFAVDEGAG